VTEKPLPQQFLDDKALGKYKLEGVMEPSGWLGLGPKFYRMELITSAKRPPPDVDSGMEVLPGNVFQDEDFLKTHYPGYDPLATEKIYVKDIVLKCKGVHKGSLTTESFDDAFTNKTISFTLENVFKRRAGEVTMTDVIKKLKADPEQLKRSFDLLNPYNGSKPF
jgi:hypothetical protein